MKSQLQRSSCGELSSIRSYPTEKLNTQSDVELEEVDIQKLNFESYYTGLDVAQLQFVQVEGELYVREFIKKLIYMVNRKITENEQIKMIPIVGYNASIERMTQPLIQYFREPEDPRPDYYTGGLMEDDEPPKFKQDQWLVQKIISVPAKINEFEQQSTNSNRQSMTAQTFMRSRVLIQDQSQNNAKLVREKFAGTVDLSEPLDVSVTEDILRAQKEKENKIKQELKEQEKRRKQKELEEEQLKYEMISKDKKSKQYTYDYDGKLISVNTMKGHKFPPVAATLGSKFEDGQTKVNMFRRKTQYQSSSSIKKKQADCEEKDTKDPNVRFSQLAPLVNENIPLQAGVLILQEDRLREGPKGQPINLENMLDPQLRMVRNEYLSLTQQINSSHNQSSTQLIKAEDKQVRDISDEDEKKKIFNRLRRLSQPQLTSQGAIKQMLFYQRINSIKIFEQVASTIYEEHEPVIMPPVKPTQKQEEIYIKSPADQYNISLYKNSTWGKETPSTAGNTTHLKGNKATVKDMLQTIGIVVKRTRERRGISETTHTSKIKNR